MVDKNSRSARADDSRCRVGPLRRGTVFRAAVGSTRDSRTAEPRPLDAYCSGRFGGGAGMNAARAAWGYIDTRDQDLMRRINRWRAPRWVRLWMIYATRCGDGWLWYALGIVLIIFGRTRRLAAIGSAILAVA